MLRLAAAPLVIVLTNPIVVRVHSETLGGERMAGRAARDADETLRVAVEAMRP
jgi:hypothetical protein